MKIDKALIIDDPWIGHILDGSKTWEMRSRPTEHRGWFGLIRKGSGAIQGIARLVDVGAPLSPAEMISAFQCHRIPEDMIRSGAVGKWNTPWKLDDVRRLDVPVPYRHKNGAVTWVTLDREVSDAIERQFDRYAVTMQDFAGNGRTDVDPLAFSSARLEPATHESILMKDKPKGTSVPDGGRLVGEVEINQANIDHNHLYLRSVIDQFPPEAIGGSNKSKAAKQMLLIDWGGPDQVRTDIDGSKKLFRARGWIGAFFRLNRAKPGDVVVIMQTGRYRYRARFQEISRTRQ